VQSGGRTGSLTLVFLPATTNKRELGGSSRENDIVEEMRLPAGRREVSQESVEGRDLGEQAARASGPGVRQAVGVSRKR